MIDKRNTHNEKNAQTQRDRNTTGDMDETRADGDDDDEAGYSEDHVEDEDGTVSHSKRRQARSFYLTPGAVKRMESKEDGGVELSTDDCRQPAGITDANSFFYFFMAGGYFFEKKWGLTQKMEPSTQKMEHFSIY